MLKRYEFSPVSPSITSKPKGQKKVFRTLSGIRRACPKACKVDGGVVGEGKGEVEGEGEGEGRGGGGGGKGIEGEKGLERPITQRANSLLTP
ncbi:hypothetical protein HZH68_012740 [Vespula germanica]|uniref:Uncharacterized protein n=1 Tax=Vespula germanica TaxID=30212 RepID=A0A834MXV7_VESGE|nr:hypothetical protein HZH68_012740 [Vespula germanica]